MGERRHITEIQEGRPPPGQHILVIDDEPVVCHSCERVLSAGGHEVDSRQDPNEGLRAALTGNYDVILLDLVMPGMPGLEILKRLQEAPVTSEVVVITGHATVETAVEAMKLGATDFVCKPFNPDELRMTLARVVERSALIRENAALRRELESRQEFEGIIGESRPMQRVFSMIKRVAPTEATVLVTGESGTGKEMVAHAIHKLSRRKDKPFLACDCTSLAPTLLESELFGHVKGSFSGAIATKQGLFEVADRGTLFLDEVANISIETQGKLLRVLETGEFKRVGDTAERKANIRVIAAANRDLAELVQEGNVREDLFYRLNVVPIRLPPLRERGGDIPLLAMSFLEHFRKRMQIKCQGFTPETMRVLEGHRWPGNVRQLKNVVERIAILCDAERVEPRHLPAELQETPSWSTVSSLPRKWEEFKAVRHQVQQAAVRDLERRFLAEALDRSGGNVTKAAEEVGMQRTNFHSLMHKHGLTSGSLPRNGEH